MITNTKVLFPELSYQINGLLFEVQNNLGRKLQEKYYQRAVETGLANLGLTFQREVKSDLVFEGKKIGHYFLDFLIDGKIILETKAVIKLERQDFRQVLSYLRAEDLELGLLVNFREPSLKIRRILNTRR